VDFAKQVDAELGERRVTILDIGGGLSANYETDVFKPSYAEYAAALQQVRGGDTGRTARGSVRSCAASCTT
jgi:diaminopimelate decarboxylase